MFPDELLADRIVKTLERRGQLNASQIDDYVGMRLTGVGERDQPFFDVLAQLEEQGHIGWVPMTVEFADAHVEEISHPYMSRVYDLARRL